MQFVGSLNNWFSAVGLQLFICRDLMFELDTIDSSKIDLASPFIPISAL